MIKAKPILEGKFWLVEDEGKRVGTLTKEEDRYLLSSKGDITFFKNERQLKQKYGKNFLTAKITNDDLSVKSVHGYPTKTHPYNSMFDITRKLPLFTKSEKSKSVYCAGYSVIEFEKGWVKSFCPKLITIERYNSKGPFKTEIEMRQELSRVNSK